MIVRMTYYHYDSPCCNLQSHSVLQNYENVCSEPQPFTVNIGHKPLQQTSLNMFCCYLFPPKVTPRWIVNAVICFATLEYDVRITYWMSTQSNRKEQEFKVGAWWGSKAIIRHIRYISDGQRPRTTTGKKMDRQSMVNDVLNSQGPHDQGLKASQALINF